MKIIGVILLAVSGVLLLLIPLSMAWTFQEVANDSALPRPADLAEGISGSLLLGAVAVPVGLLGLVLLILGFVMRKPDRHDQHPDVL